MILRAHRLRAGPGGLGGRREDGGWDEWVAGGIGPMEGEGLMNNGAVLSIYGGALAGRLNRTLNFCLSPEIGRAHV